MKKSIIYIILAILALGTFPACNGASKPSPTSPIINPTSPTTVSGGYPYPQPQYTPQVVSDQGYPGPAVPTSAPLTSINPEKVTVPTPENGLGVVTGQLIIANQNKPYLSLLYLARTINAKETSVPPMIAFSETTDPKAIQDVTGKFVFSGIKPGVYAIVIWTPGGGTVLMDKNQQNHLLVTVEANKVTDLGMINVK